MKQIMKNTMKKIATGFFIVLFAIAALLCDSCSSIENASDSDTTQAVHSLFVEPDDGKGEIIDAIQKARHSIKLTIYNINDPDIISALEVAAKRGVEIRILYNYYSFSAENQANIKEVMQSLEAQGIQTKAANSKFANTHEKTFVIDNNRAIVMNLNLQNMFFTYTRDFCIISTNASEVSEIARVFESDWNYEDVTPSGDSLVWSPDNSRAKLVKLIQSAKKTLDIYNEEAADEEILNELIKAAQSGVTVRFISAQVPGADGQDQNIPGRKLLNENGVQAKYGDFLIMHAKMILVDYDSVDSKAFVGSENFTGVSLDQNRELGIIVEENQILDRLHSIFEGDWVKCKFDADTTY